MFYRPQEPFLIIHEIQLDPYTILHQFLLSSNTLIKQVNQKIIIRLITHQLLINFMIHSFTPFVHHSIRIFKQIILLKMFLNLTKTTIQQLYTHIHIYYKHILHKVKFLHKIKEHLIQTLYNLLIEDLKTLQFHIYLLTLYIK